jgi:hypothetical protein
VPCVVDRRVDDVDQATKGDAKRREVSALLAADDPLEGALARALDRAAEAGRFDVVAQLARELEARRLARAGNVVAFDPKTRQGARVGHHLDAWLPFLRRPQLAGPKFRGAQTAYAGTLKEEGTATIVEGPTPASSGHVVFKVRVGEQFLPVIATPNGVGVDQEGHDLASVSQAMSAVFRFLEQHEAETRGWYLEAARLRRSAGNPSLFRASPSTHVSVLGDPRCVNGSVVFRTRATSAEVKVMVSKDGSVIHGDDRGVTSADCEAAIAAVLDHILTNPEEALAIGIDVELFTELYG